MKSIHFFRIQILRLLFQYENSDQFQYADALQKSKDILATA